MTERKAQIKRLEELYQQDGNQLVILYGRRENGIRELLQDFVKRKNPFITMRRRFRQRHSNKG